VYFERAVTSDEPLSEAGREKFLALASERGQELLTELDTYLTRLAATEGGASGKRYGVGVYFFDNQLSDSKESDEDRPPPKSSPVEEIDVLAGLSRQK